MEATIQNSIKYLRIAYISHIIIIVVILIFNFILLNQIYWLKDIFKHIYFITTLCSLIHFILPVVILLFICLNKLKKNNFNIFKILTIIFCVIAIIFGFFYSGLFMINAIESPEFCKECPFNLPIQEINNIIKSNDLNNKCKERRCIINTINYETIKNEEGFYDYLCNYNPSSEFEQIKESKDNIDNNIIINNNNTITEDNNDNIICNKIDNNNLIISDLENNFVYNFYDKCNNYTEFYLCERSKLPNKFNLKDNFVCPETNYITKLVTFCMLNVILNIVINFIPIKLEYNKFVEMIQPQRRNIPKSNSFNSTFNSSKLPKDNIETEEKFVRTPTEIIIVCSNNNNNININNNKENKNNNKNKIIKKEEENNINNELVIKKAKTKKINFNPVADSKIVKNKLDPKSTKNMVNVNNIKIMKKLEKEKTEEIKDKKSKYSEDDNKITLSNDDNTISTKRIILSDNNINTDL